VTIVWSGLEGSEGPLAFLPTCTTRTDLRAAVGAGAVRTVSPLHGRPSSHRPAPGRCPQQPTSPPAGCSRGHPRAQAPIRPPGDQLCPAPPAEQWGCTAPRTPAAQRAGRPPPARGGHGAKFNHCPLASHFEFIILPRSFSSWKENLLGIILIYH